MAKNTWQEMKMNHVISGFAVTLTGMIVTAFLWWFFGGFGFWALPGLAILLIGVAELCYIVFKAITGNKSTVLHTGLLVLFVGAAGYLSLASHVMLGVLQIVALVLMVIGIVLFAIGITRASKL